MSLRVCVNKHLSFGYFLVFLSHPIKKISMHFYTHIQIEKMDAAYMHDTIDIYKLIDCALLLVAGPATAQFGCCEQG